MIATCKGAQIGAKIRVCNELGASTLIEAQIGITPYGLNGVPAREHSSGIQNLLTYINKETTK